MSDHVFFCLNTTSPQKKKKKLCWSGDVIGCSCLSPPTHPCDKHGHCNTILHALNCVGGVIQPHSIYITRSTRPSRFFAWNIGSPNYDTRTEIIWVVTNHAPSIAPWGGTQKNYYGTYNLLSIVSSLCRQSSVYWSTQTLTLHSMKRPASYYKNVTTTIQAMHEWWRKSMPDHPSHRPQPHHHFPHMPPDLVQER